MTLLENIDGEQCTHRDPDAQRGRPWFAIVVLLLCGLLVFAHFGCHGDEDTELLVQWSGKFATYADGISR